MSFRGRHAWGRHHGGWGQHPHHRGWAPHGFRMGFPGPYVRARLHRRLFWWFGASILATGLTVMVVSSLVSVREGPSWWTEVQRMQTFAAGQFARVWDNPGERDALAAAMARDLDVDVVLSDSGGRTLSAFGQPCTRPSFRISVARAGAAVGTVSMCMERHHGTHSFRFFIPMLAALGVLWAVTGRIARRLARPLGDLAQVAKELGAGRLSSRAQLCRGDHGEVRVLAEAFNDMAERIERQLKDQRELLAAVSHELRTPLGHIRLLVELAREGGADPRALDELDREVVEMDSLVGQLLASSRLDFAALTLSRLDAADLARRALERAGVEGSRLVVEGEPAAFEGDATLTARALANLIDNAQKHGRGLERLRVKGRPGFVSFEVEDKGEGFAPGEELRAFEAFYRRPKAEREGQSLGLGLALVKRTAEAHGGTAYAGNLPGGGARVGFEVPTAAAASEAEAAAGARP